MTNCEICPIVASKSDGKDVVVLETDLWRVTLDANQRFLGKCFVTLKAHKPTLSDLDEEDWQEFRTIIKQLEAAVKKAFNPSHFNWLCLMNYAAMRGQRTHVHWHLHPRYSEKRELGGEVFKDTQWYPRKEKTDHVVSQVTLQIIAEQIKKEL